MLRDREAAQRRGCETRKGTLLRRLYIGFPAGVAGIALTILRFVLGAAVMVQGVRYLANGNSGWVAPFGGVLLLGSGMLLLLGLLTPIGAAVTFLWEAAVKLSLAPAASPKLFDSLVSVAFAFTILVAIAAMGPGAFSVDARLFGRKEIIIPRQRS